MTFILRGQFHKLFEIHTLINKIESHIITEIKILKQSFSFFNLDRQMTTITFQDTTEPCYTYNFTLFTFTVLWL